jgi:aminoglycoside phosphotransferase (APT) family kinase protein
MVAEVSPADRLAHPPPAWALARVPGLEDGRLPQHLERLGGGTVNQVYRVDSTLGRFVLRLNGAAWRRPGVDRTRELALHRAAAAGGVAPAIVDAEPQSQGLLIMEFHEGSTWSAAAYSDPACLRRLGERLYALHCLPAPGVEPFDPLQVARDYVRLIDPTASDALVNPMRRLEGLCRRLQDGPPSSVVVHGDLWQGNVLDGSRLWLLDWEYAQRSDPLMDVACVLAYYPDAGPYQRDLAAAAGLDALSRAGELADRAEIYRILSWLWHLARGEKP